MSAEGRFFPGICPDCGESVVAPYTRYARAPAHPLYLPLLVGNFLLAVVLVGVAFWAVANVIDAALGGQRGAERGALHFIAVCTVASSVIWASVRLAKLIGRLPRRFTYECGSCRWVGRVNVVVGALPDDAGLTARVVEVGDAGPLATMRDRLDHRESSRRRAEQDGPPNPDFDFGRREP